MIVPSSRPGTECAITNSTQHQRWEIIMKKKKRMSIDESRRRFMAYFSSVGLGSTLAPGILWGRMQETGSQQITLDMLTTALKLGGVEFTAEERQTMVNTANQNLTRAVAMRSFHIPNDV